MLIRALEIQGFKSFPDKTVLTFDPGITAIVGPNGSGKSNISDAVRWVLGEQSTKSLRGSKMEDVVFNGTMTRRPRGYAEVSLSIDNRDRRLAFDNDEVKVTRRYYRSGDSDYLLNGTAVRLKDVNELFMDTGLGRDGYSVISQGKIADLVSGRGEDRREMFEEAAGISRYRYRKAEAERRLEQAQENVVRLEDILRELEQRIGPLKEQAEKAKQFLALAEEKKGLEICLWMMQSDRLAAQLEEQETKRAQAAQLHDALTAQLTGLETELDEAYAQLNACTAQMDESRRTIAAHEQTRTRLESDNAVSRNDIAHFRERIGRIDAELALLAQTGEELAAAQKEKEQQQAQRQKQATALQKEIGRMEKESAGYTDQLYQLVRQESSVREELAVYTSALSEARTTDITADSTMTEIRTRQEEAVHQQEEAEAEIRRLAAELERLESECKARQQARVALNNQLQGYTLRLNNQKKKAEAQRTQAEGFRLNAESERRRADLLEELERSYEGYGHSVKLVMKESGRGRLSGIHGPVSRILQVPAELSVAIETALGGAMQHIVCASEGDAKRGIALLKQQDGGRATFLPLTAVKGTVLQESGLAQCEGFIGIASELVQCDAQYQPVCRWLLGRTVVAEDLDAAVAMARQYRYRFRIVTTDGQVVNAGGSMTGGSMAKNAGLLSRRAQIEQARQQAEQWTSQEQQAAQRLKTLRDALSADEAALLQVQSRMTSLQEEDIRSRSEIRRLNSLNENLQKTCERLDGQRQSADRRLEELSALRAQAAQQLEIAEAQKKTAEQRLERLSMEKSLLQAQRDVAAARISEKKMELLGVERDVQQLEQDIGELTRRTGDEATRRSERTTERASLERQIEDTEQQVARRTDEMDALAQKIAVLQAENQQRMVQRTQLEQKQAELRSTVRAETARRETLARELARLEEQRDTRQQEYDALQHRLWEEYELTPREARGVAAKVEQPQQAQRRLSELKNRIKALGSVNVGAIEEYREVYQRYRFMKDQLDDVEKARKELMMLIDRLTGEMKKRFMERFQAINEAFGETFRALFGGGSAGLSLADPSDVLGSNIEITIQPQGKIISNIEALSGGEKSLAAIALYFAIMKVSPTPFCIMDEIEAALDDANVTRFAAYLRRMSPTTQYIAITHRRGTMEEADVLYGVTMQEKGVSKLLRLPVSEIEARLGVH